MAGTAGGQALRNPDFFFDYLREQTRNQSLFMWYGGGRRLGVRLRCAGGLTLFVPSHETPRARQPNPQSSLTPKTHK